MDWMTASVAMPQLKYGELQWWTKLFTAQRSSMVESPWNRTVCWKYVESVMARMNHWQREIIVETIVENESAPVGGNVGYPEGVQGIAGSIEAVTRMLKPSGVTSLSSLDTLNVADKIRSHVAAVQKWPCAFPTERIFSTTVSVESVLE